MKPKHSVRDFMSKSVRTIKPSDTLIDALLITCSHDTRHLPIVEKDELVGIISDRDIKRALPTKGEKSNDDVWSQIEKIHVRDIMTRNVITIAPDADLRDAASMMMREKISALPVLVDGKLAGILTTEDILWAYTTEV